MRERESKRNRESVRTRKKRGRWVGKEKEEERAAREEERQEKPWKREKS